MQTLKFTLIALLACCLFSESTTAHGDDTINFSKGRIAISHDGNNYDKDDYVAAAMNLALIQATGLNDKLVYFDHSCHLKNKKRQYKEMLESVNEGAKRFNIDPAKIFDCQEQLDEAIKKFKTEAEKSKADDPLWFCIGGPMEVPWQCINAVDPAKRKFIYCISHSSPFNETHVSPPKMTHTWDDIDALGVVTIRIKNQNKTDWNTNKKNVYWMRDSDNPNLQWLHSRNAKSTYDTSDSGMLWWVITGGQDGGNENAGWKEYKPVLEKLKFDASEKSEKPAATSYAVEKNGLVILEAEETASDLDQWVKKTDRLKSPYTGPGYLEFTGNKTSSGPPRSPLEYTFKINNAGFYYIHLHCARETVDGRKDVANDCYIRVEGDFEAGPKVGKSQGDHAPLETLQKDTKFFGGDDNSFTWATGNRLDLGGHKNKRVALYRFKAGSTYKLVVSGRSQKYKLNRIVFRHESVNSKLAQDLRLPNSPQIEAKKSKRK